MVPINKFRWTTFALFHYSIILNLTNCPHWLHCSIFKCSHHRYQIVRSETMWLPVNNKLVLMNMFLTNNWWNIAPLQQTHMVSCLKKTLVITSNKFQITLWAYAIFRFSLLTVLLLWVNADDNFYIAQLLIKYQHFEMR